VSLEGEPRPLDRSRDLVRVVKLFRRAHADPKAPDWQHPGGMQWWLRRVAKDDLTVRVWDDATRLAGVVIDDAGTVIARTADGRTASRMRVLAWTERAFRAGGRSSFEVAVADDERDLREALAAHGYAPSGAVWNELVIDLASGPPAAPLPAGFRLETIDAIGDDAYVALHRASWSDTKPSDYSRVLHDLVTAMPDFRRDLVPVVVAPDGTPAAYCIGWLDETTRSVEIEPLGTHAKYRRLGLARAIVREVHRRAWRLDARSVMVWATDPASSAHVNEPARRLYTSTGMRPRRVVRDYRKDLRAG
jgi:GNAT superfamily N-acetyltransferase